jgi:PKD repeat protein
METPPSGSFSISYPSGNTLSTFPGSIPIQITDNNVPSGLYELSVVGKGPNGTPVHKREISISVVDPAPPVTDFTANSTNPIVNTQVNFTDLSTNAPTSWSWSFNPATVTFLNGTNASSQNPQVAFTAGGDYTVTLTATNVYGSDGETKVDYITASTCTPCESYSNNATEEWISNVTFNTINNSSSTTAGYENYTALSTDVMKGNTYLVSVSCGSTGSWPENYWVYFDWNSDCDFNDTGESYDLGGLTGSGTLSTNITIPLGTTSGAKRMRAILKYNADPVSGCEVGYSFGQTEDYTVNVLHDDIVLDIAAMLEGPFNGTNMDASLQTLIPLNQPFNITPWFYSGTESVAAIPNTNVVDWVLVDVRDAASAASATGIASVAKQAAFILNDGSIVDLDGSSNLQFTVTISQNLYVVIWQRNHIGIMSNNALTGSGGVYSYNFTSGVNQVYGGLAGHKQIATGVWGMFSGDGDHNGTIGEGDKFSTWEDQSGTKGYLFSDYNLDSESNNIDKDDYWLPNISKGTQVPN